MHRHLLPLLAFGVAAGACESSPVKPTVTAATTPPAVATAKVNTWDTRDELDPWVAPGTSSGALSLMGDGSDAVVRIELKPGTIRLRGPELDPSANQVGSARMRFRWLDAGANESLFMSVYLRPVEFVDSLVLPRLTVPVTNNSSAEQRSGNWLERTFTVTTGSPMTPPFTIKFAVVDFVQLGSSGSTPLHGTVEIDWIALLR